MESVSSSAAGRKRQYKEAPPLKLIRSIPRAGAHAEVEEKQADYTETITQIKTFTYGNVGPISSLSPSLSQFPGALWALYFLRDYWSKPHNLYYNYVICFSGEGKQENMGLFLVM